MINSDVFIKSFRFLLTCSRCFLRNFSLNSRNRNFIIFRNAQEFRKSHILILQEQEAKQDIKMLSKAQQECALYSACLYISVFQNKNSHDNFGDHQIVLVISKRACSTWLKLVQWMGISAFPLRQTAEIFSICFFFDFVKPLKI